MYSSYLTRETFENEHDEKMTRKFSYNYQVLKRLFPEVYKLPESEIRSLVRSIYDNPKMGDELLDHLSNVINKRKPEWGEYLNPKPEEPEQPVQNNPLQPVQPKPLNTDSGFEPYKPQKSAFGLNNTNNFGLNNSGVFSQTKLPDLTKGMDLKHSDMVTGFGINENKQKEMLALNPLKQTQSLSGDNTQTHSGQTDNDIDYAKVYRQVKNDHPYFSSEAYNKKWNTPIIEQISYMPEIYKNYSSLYDMALHDKYKHAYLNCIAAQQGYLNDALINNLSQMKEVYDVKTSRNTEQESAQDMYANLIGRYLGSHYPYAKCEDLITPYISKEYPK